jgi:hypothetical protein
MKEMRSFRPTGRRWDPRAGLVLAAVFAVAAGMSPQISAPVGQTYYTVAVGLESGYDVKTQCFEFFNERLCTLDGSICGFWQPAAARGRPLGFSYDLTTLDDGKLMQMEGRGWLEARGRKSSISGTGWLGAVEGNDRGRNFSFAGRAVGKEECLDLLGDEGPDDVTVIVGSGNVASEDRAVEDFHGLIASGVGRVEIRHGASESLRITADDNILPILTSEVRNGRLVLGTEPGTSYRTHNDVLFEITVRELDEVTVSGVMAVDASGIDTDRFEVNVSGVSRLTAAGRADRQSVLIAGVSRYDAEDLASRTVEIDVTGLSSAVVRVSERLTGSASGGSVLEYIGNPVVDVAVDFLSTLRKIG